MGQYKQAIESSAARSAEERGRAPCSVLRRHFKERITALTTLNEAELRTTFI